MGQVSVIRAFVLAGALASASAAEAIDFTVVTVPLEIPAAACANNLITNVTGLAVTYNLLDNGTNVPNIRFAWTITPNSGPVINAQASFWFDPESASYPDAQDWFDDYFPGGVAVPGNPAPPWVGTIVGTPIDGNGNAVGTASRYTIQCDGTNASVVSVVSGIGRQTAAAVPVNAPGALFALILACLALGMRFAARRPRT